MTSGESRFTEQKTFAIQKEAETGDSVREVCRHHGASAATSYQWKSKTGGLAPKNEEVCL